MNKTTNQYELRKHARWLSLPFTLVLWGLYLGFRYPGYISEPTSRIFKIDSAWALIPAFFSGYAIAIVCILAWHRRSFWRGTLSCTWRKAILSIALMLITPFATWGPIPFTFLAFAPHYLSELVRNGPYVEAVFAWSVAAFGAGAWYIIASLLISGVKSGWMARSFAFCLVYAGIYFGTMLFNGYGGGL